MLTFSFALYLLGVSVFATRLLLMLLTLATLVEVLHHDADEHVEHEEADEQQERDEVRQTPFVVVRPRLSTQHNDSTNNVRWFFCNKNGENCVYFAEKLRQKFAFMQKICFHLSLHRCPACQQ